MKLIKELPIDYHIHLRDDDKRNDILIEVEKFYVSLAKWMDDYYAAGGGSVVLDAPSDGKLYGRFNGTWVEIPPAN